MTGNQQICVLGATGSIGRQTLAVMAENPELKAFALTARSSSELLEQQCLQFQPRYAVLEDAGLAESLQLRLREQGCETEVLFGAEALDQVAADAEVDQVMAGIVGAAGLPAALAAAAAGKRLLLANKEALVMSGDMLLQEVARTGGSLVPVDSEHNAIFQCLSGRSADQARADRLTLTASGGPFRETPLAELAAVTPAQACAHPVWEMGPKISVDSATMMNKGLELIEACLLFSVPSERVDILIHPQSTVHSLVSFIDGSVLAQLGCADMRIPIAYALGFPERLPSGAPTLSLAELGRLDFYEPDSQRFPALTLARSAAQARGTAPTLLNAANEEAVAAFLEGQIRFTEITSTVDRVLQKIPCESAASLAIILDADQRARKCAKELILKSKTAR